jgi:hypothetical protein
VVRDLSHAEVGIREHRSSGLDVVVSQFRRPASDAASAPLGITLAPKNHPPDPIRQFAPNLEASHRMLIFKAEVIRVRVAETWTSILKIWQRKFGVSHLSFL